MSSTVQKVRLRSSFGAASPAGTSTSVDAPARKTTAKGESRAGARPSTDWYHCLAFSRSGTRYETIWADWNIGRPPRSQARRHAHGAPAYREWARWSRAAIAWSGRDPGILTRR